MGCTFLKAGFALFLGTSGGDHAGAEGPGDLDRGNADTARRAVHEDGLSFSHSASLQQGMIGGGVSTTKHAGLRQRQGCRHLVAQFGLGVADLRKGT